MLDEPMKCQIIIKILILLLSKRRVSAREIADRYEISVRSVYRYIDELSIAGIPVEGARGKYGGIYIADTFKLPTGFFSREEYAAAINAMSAMLGQVKDEKLASALEKLNAQLKLERQDISVCGNIIVDGGGWGSGRKFNDKLQVCEKAVEDKSSIFIDYISRDGEHSKRVIDPYVLIFKQNVWYVYAFCHTKQDFRTFKVGRIKNASFTGRSFEKREFTRADIPLDFTYDEEKLVEVALEISKESLPDAEEWLGIDCIEPRGDKFVANVSLPDDDGLINKILSYGGGVKVISPENINQKVKATAQKIAEIP